ncbi:TylF/MycF/NovP-related O-methyltransferase [Pseudodesulfovibrio sp.]|uniref:TylF/MycF/NovP-related O-methyltransferase n=1 Tax=Pseudodesulfovibrio sp. TaxID=2035812 RepID=UPI00263567CC|nr:TylF/MycF/NovP-related O-methyltransferase [Pseudodesulfovibrio sp.]MDD3312711.1 macrocin O-methyltransferase [Pseudodesulfovibrio sp.]
MKLRIPQDIEYKDINDPAFARMASVCAPYSLTVLRGLEPFYALYKAVEYLVKHNITGDFAECGVWRGGSMMLAALACRHFGDQTRRIHLFDTFEGNPEPRPEDLDWDGQDPHPTWEEYQKRGMKWGYGGPLEDVRRNVLTTEYPQDRFVFVPGRVEETLPGAAPGSLALLRLDTDLYESTAHELRTLYPRLVPGGVLIVDDYGYYQGARKATDEYLAETGAVILLNRIDASVRLGVKVA